MTLRATSALGRPALPVIAIAIMIAVVAVQMVKDVTGVMIIMKIAMVTVVVTGICLVALGGMYNVLFKGHSRLTYNNTHQSQIVLSFTCFWSDPYTMYHAQKCPNVLF